MNAAIAPELGEAVLFSVDTPTEVSYFCSTEGAREPVGQEGDVVLREDEQS